MDFLLAKKLARKYLEYYSRIDYSLLMIEKNSQFIGKTVKTLK